jgi:hypothetical protein
MALSDLAKGKKSKHSSESGGGASIDDAKRIDILRTQYLDERNSTHFAAAVIIFISVALISFFVSMPIFFGSANTSKVSKAQEKYQLPCFPIDTSPIQPSNISLRVLNGTDKSGFAIAVGDSLSTRGFSVVEVDNSPIITNDTQIRFGKNAIVAAYTLADNFDNATLILDDREDGLIDVIVGRSFVDLKELDLVQSATSSDPLVVPEDCHVADEITPIKALQHDTEKVKPFTGKDYQAGETTGEGEGEAAATESPATDGE